MWDTEQGWQSLGCAAPLPEHHVPTMSLTLCQPRSEEDGKRAGGSCGALQGPSSTRSAHAAGQGCCSTARCLLGRREPGQGVGCFPLTPQNLGAAPCLPRDPHALQPQAPPCCACQHPGGGDGRSPEERGVSAATACDQGPQMPSMEVPSGLLRTWMWYFTPGCRSRRTTQVLAWTSPCRRGARLGSGCGPQISLPIPGPTMYLPCSWGGCSCPSCGCMCADAWMNGGVPGALPTGV